MVKIEMDINLESEVLLLIEKITKKELDNQGVLRFIREVVKSEIYKELKSLKENFSELEKRIKLQLYNLEIQNFDKVPAKIKKD